ncbi:MAG: Nif11 family protein [Alphaproteobacteria bacterium]|nr:Nif11 family protein [Alphaproteobacteria bacterium]
MSLESAVQFTTKMVKSPALHEEVAKTVAGKDPKAASAAVAALGKKHGFEFTAEEAYQVREGALTMMRRDGILPDELGEKDLDQVAGGMKKPDIFTAAGWKPLTDKSGWTEIGNVFTSTSGISAFGNAMVDRGIWSSIPGTVASRVSSFFSGW